MTSRIKHTALLLCSVLGSFACATSSSANNFNNATVGQIQIDNRACIFFWLNGVSQPEPSISGDHWFALPKSTANYQEMISELISSKITGKPIFVYTDGTASCGYATVAQLGLDQ